MTSDDEIRQTARDTKTMDAKARQGRNQFMTARQHLIDRMESVVGKPSPTLRSGHNEEIVEEAMPFLALMIANQNQNNVDPNQVNEVIDPSGYTIELVDHQLDKPLVMKLRAPVPDPQFEPLTSTQLQAWKENGYLVINEALSETDVMELTNFVGQHVQKLFSIDEEVKVHSFLPGQDEYASPWGRAMVTLTGVNTNGGPYNQLSPLQSIQRIGCGIHTRFPPFRRAIMSHRNASIAHALGYDDPTIVESTILLKSAGTGRQIGAHQDGGSLYTEPGPGPSGVTFWYALEDTTASNGCLEVARGTHRVEPIRTRTVVGECGQARNVDIPEPSVPSIEGVDASTLPTKNEHGEYEFTKLEVKAGTLILMHDGLLHRSAANRSEKGRMALKFSVVEGRRTWKEDSFLQPGREGEFERLRGLD